MENLKQLTAISIKTELANLLLINLPINFFCINKEGYLVECNERLVRHSSATSADQILNKHLLELATPGAWANCQIAMSENRSITVEETFTDFEGNEKVYLSIKSPVHDQHGNVVGLIGIGIDITDKKLAEKMLAKEQAEKAIIKATAENEKRQAVTVLAGSIAHDLRTPLTSINLVSDLLKQSLDKLQLQYQDASSSLLKEKFLQQLQTQLSVIQEFPSKFKKITRQMDDFITVTLKTMKKLAMGTLSQEDFTECELEPLVDEVISKYPFKDNQKNIIHIQSLQNFSFLGCPVIFYRIIFNILNNSFEQISKNQHGEIFINTKQTSDANYLIIKDTAGGASPEIVAHLFDGYKTTKRKGTGVGLAFCKLAMENFGGNITCQSIPGKSIEFALKFPSIPDKLITN